MQPPRGIGDLHLWLPNQWTTVGTFSRWTCYQPVCLYIRHVGRLRPLGKL